MDHVAINILESVAADAGANPARRKPTVFLATFVSQELVDPKAPANYSGTKGKQVNIPAPTW